MASSVASNCQIITNGYFVSQDLCILCDRNRGVAVYCSSPKSEQDNSRYSFLCGSCFVEWIKLKKTCPFHGQDISAQDFSTIESKIPKCIRASKRLAFNNLVASIYTIGAAVLEKVQLFLINFDETSWDSRLERVTTLDSFKNEFFDCFPELGCLKGLERKKRD